MIPKLLILGVDTILKIICEKIIIKNIKIINKNKNFNIRTDELYINAESIVFNKININKISIKIKDIILQFAITKNNFFIKSCYAEVKIRLSKDNINKTLSEHKWDRLKTSIESFILMSFKNVDIKNKSIYFVSSDGFLNKDIYYNLQYDNNSISLVNNINKEKLSILNDKNIIINNLYFNGSYIELELSSKIIFSK